MGLGPWGQGWGCTGAFEVEKMGPWRLLAMGPGAMGHGGHRGRRDGAMRGGRSGWEGRSKGRAACTGALYGARSHGSL